MENINQMSALNLLKLVKLIAVKIFHTSLSLHEYGSYFIDITVNWLAIIQYDLGDILSMMSLGYHFNTVSVFNLNNPKVAH